MKKFVPFAWDMQIHTDRELSVNRPDIVIKDHAKWCCKVIDMSVLSDRNTSTKVIEKISTYETPSVRAQDWTQSQKFASQFLSQF